MGVLKCVSASLLLIIPSVVGQGRIGPSIGDTYRPNENENVVKVEVPASRLQDLEYFDFFVPNSRGPTRLHHKPGSPRSSWLGESSDGIYTINLVKRKDQVFGSVGDEKTGLIHQLSMDAEGNSILRSTHISDFPPEQDPKDVVERSDLQGTRFLRTAKERSTNLNGPFKSDNTFTGPRSVEFGSATERVLVDDTGSNLDVMVVWTKKAECRNSGLAEECSPTTQTDANMRSLVDLAIAETNTAYLESGVQTELRLVHAYLDSTYVEASSTAFSTALNDVRRTSDGEMDDVHAKRTEFGADIVAMLIDDSEYCGIGYIGPHKDYMFSVTAWNCATGYYSFGHEIGHNLGCRHDKGTENACSSNNYNYGYRHPSAEFRSIMAYTCRSGECDGNAGGGCMRVQRFSNPTYQYNNKAIGDSTTDNARRINDVRATVAAYFPAMVMECQEDTDCDDQDICTEDVCDEILGCTHSAIEGCPPTLSPTTSSPVVVSLPPTIAPVANTPLTAIVVLNFEGDATDSTPNHIDGIVNGNSQFYTDSDTDSQYVAFDQSQSEHEFVSLGQPSLLNFGTDQDFTVSIWVRTSYDFNQDSPYNDPPLMSNKDWNSGRNKGWLVAAQGNGRWQWNIGDGANRCDYDSQVNQLNDGEWHHIVASHDRSSGVIGLFFDGVNEAEISCPNVGDVTSGFPTSIGADGAPLDNIWPAFFTGDLDRASIYGSALDSTDVAALYVAGRAPQETPTNPPTESTEPTQAPVVTVNTPSPTRASTNIPTKTPTESPTQAPTNSPSPAPTKGPIVSSTQSPVADNHLPSSAIAIFNFEGDATDSTSNELHGIVNGNAQFDSDTEGYYLTLDQGQSSHQFVSIGQPSLLNFGTDQDFTVSIWARTSYDFSQDSPYSDPPLMSNKDWNSGRNKGWLVATQGNGRWQWNIGDGTNRCDYDSQVNQLNDGQWHHIVASHDRVSGVVSLFFDGVSEAEISCPDVGDVTSGLRTCIGADGAPWDNTWPAYFTGDLDRASIYGSALDSSDVAALYAAGRSPQGTSTNPPTEPTEPTRAPVVTVDTTSPTTTAPTNSPTKMPTESPTQVPTLSPTSTPTQSPTSSSPTESPSKSPTVPPTTSPTFTPTASPITPAPTTTSPTSSPSKSPTVSPTESPTPTPTQAPTKSPSPAPTQGPIEVTTPSPVADNNFPSSAIAIFNFEGDATDSTSNELHGTVNGNAQFASDTEEGYYLALDQGQGEHQFVSIGQPSQLDFGTDRDFTVSVWVRTSHDFSQDAPYSDPPLISNKDWNSGQNRGWLVAAQPSGRWQWNIGDGNNRCDYDSQVSQIDDGVWHHIVASHDRINRAVDLFFDGTLETEVSCPNVGDLTSGLPTSIGADGAPFDNTWPAYFTGDLDAVSIYGSALDANDVAALYAAGRGAPPSTPTTAPSPTGPPSPSPHTSAPTLAPVIVERWDFTGNSRVGENGNTFPFINIGNNVDETGGSKDDTWTLNRDTGYSGQILSGSGGLDSTAYPDRPVFTFVVTLASWDLSRSGGDGYIMFRVRDASNSDLARLRFGAEVTLAGRPKTKLSMDVDGGSYVGGYLTDGDAHAEADGPITFGWSLDLSNGDYNMWTGGDEVDDDDGSSWDHRSYSHEGNIPALAGVTVNHFDVAWLDVNDDPATDAPNGDFLELDRVVVSMEETPPSGGVTDAPTMTPALTADEVDRIESDLGIVLDADVAANLAVIVKPATSQSWRTDAEERIESHRKVDVTIEVVESDGSPLQGATIQARLKNHAFKFGGVLRLKDWNDVDGNLSGISTDRYREVFLRLFNSAGFANAFKTTQLRWGWNVQYLPDFMTWAEENDLPVRGHTLIWPGVDDDNNHLPSAGTYDLTTPVRALEDAIADSNSSHGDIDVLEQDLRDEIQFVLSDWAARWDVYEWDVINEPRQNHRVQDLLGVEEMAEWFKIAEESVPDPTTCKFVLNDYAVISASSPADSPAMYVNHRDAMAFAANVVIDNGGRLDRIGFQSRMTRGHLDPSLVYDRLDEFADAFGLEMVGTEFEVKDNDSTDFYPDEYTRSQITEETLTVYFSHRLVTGLTVWSYMGDGEAPMCNYDGTVKLNALVWYYLHRIRYHTEEDGLVTGADGTVPLRGFKGTYEMVVANPDGGGTAEQTFEVDVTEDGSTVRLQLQSQDEPQDVGASVAGAAATAADVQEVARTRKHGGTPTATPPS